MVADEARLIAMIQTLGVVLVLVVAALVAHRLFVFVARRITQRTRTQSDELLLDHLAKPLRWIMVALALNGLDQIATSDTALAGWIISATRVVMPVLWGMMAIALIRFAKRYIDKTSDIDVEDNLGARRRRTRADILARIAVVIVIVISAGLMLLNIPAVREIGVALVASAGLAGLAVGVAAQPLLKNIVGGFQLAFTEPVRIDDVIVYRGEWGRIEQIGLTYVVLRIWDQRRLVIPVSKLVEEPIENWTRQTSDLLGAVFIHVDHAADIAALRDIALNAVQGHRLWDGRVAALQVTDMTAQTLELRVLMSGRNGSELFDLRCDVREAVVRALAETLPRSLNRNRVTLDATETEL
ncbi:MAG: mechanosensitive ion channel [Sphingomonadales bacterium]|nr:mechanosensitive ion channel [Sphingomonadales bacterium]NCQ20719.1 mechanosensitive ion channel [Sphingomonadales bacterium]NCT03717.1 mechanosensitive ion channel [Sphingomonadales bacterium]